MTDNLALSQVAASQNQKEVTINDHAGELGATLTARLAIAVTSSNARALTKTELRRYFFFDLDPDGGDPPDAAITPTVPSGISRSLFAVINDTGFDVTVEITGQALTAPTIDNGEAALLTSDGVNVRLTGGGPAVIAALGDITDVVVAGLAQGHMLRRNGASEWVNEETPYDLSFFLPGTYPGGALMAQVVLDRVVTFGRYPGQDLRQRALRGEQHGRQAHSRVEERGEHRGLDCRVSPGRRRSAPTGRGCARRAAARSHDGGLLRAGGAAEQRRRAERGDGVHDVLRHHGAERVDQASHDEAAGRYVLATRSFLMPVSQSSSPAAPIAAKLVPSTPGAPPLVRASA